VSETKYCPNGDGEFEPWVTACLDCGADLVDEPPPPPPPVDHSLAVVDVDLSPDDCKALGLLLDGDRIAHEWDGQLLRLPRASQARAEELIEWLGGTVDPSEQLEDPPPVDGEGADEDELATLWQRIGGALIDGVITGVPVSLIYTALGSVHPWIGVTIIALYRIGLVATRGRTIGKALVGTRVADATTGGMPAIDQATLRWLLEGGVAAFISLVVGVRTPIGAFAGIAVLLPIVLRPDRRGLHDLAARTIVLRADRWPRR
jgi:uncharacterized RDD family membrane protein YckC